MFNVGRNDPCPCGSGKKFKHCHLGREDQLLEEIVDLDDKEVGRRITELERVRYGRSRELADAVDFRKLTGKEVKVRYVNFHEYLGIGFNPKPGPPKGASASMIINPLKTQDFDPGAVYIAVTPKVNDSTLLHELAHVLDYLESGFLPGSQHELSDRTGVPTEHFDHTMEFARWLDLLRKEFGVELDAEDMIVAFLKDANMLLSTAEIKEREERKLQVKSKKIMRYLQEHRDEIIPLIQNREGFIGEGAPGVKE